MSGEYALALKRRSWGQVKSLFQFTGLIESLTNYLYSNKLLNEKGGESVNSSMRTHPAEKMSMEGRSSTDDLDEDEEAPSSGSAGSPTIREKNAVIGGVFFPLEQVVYN